MILQLHLEPNYDIIELNFISQSVTDFPTRIEYDGKQWSWVFYDPTKPGTPGDFYGVIDYTLTFTRSKELQQNIEKLENLSQVFLPYGFRSKKDRVKCECGGEKTNQPGHSYYCPKFSINP